MINFFSAFFALLILGYAALNLLGLVMGAELAIAVIIVALVALLLSLLISQNEKLDRLTAEVKALKEQIVKAPEETDHGAE